jgi:hypothetical protein
MQRKLDKQKPSKNGGTKNTLYEWDGQQQLFAATLDYPPARTDGAASGGHNPFTRR